MSARSEIEGPFLLIKVRVQASKIRLGDRLMGDPLVWVLRGEPRVIEEELPHTVWRRSGPRRTQPWEGAD